MGGCNNITMNNITMTRNSSSRAIGVLSIIFTVALLCCSDAASLSQENIDALETIDAIVPEAAEISMYVEDILLSADDKQHSPKAEREAERHRKKAERFNHYADWHRKKAADFKAKSQKAYQEGRRSRIGHHYRGRAEYNTRKAKHFRREARKAEKAARLALKKAKKKKAKKPKAKKKKVKKPKAKKKKAKNVPEAAEISMYVEDSLLSADDKQHSPKAEREAERHRKKAERFNHYADWHRKKA